MPSMNQLPPGFENIDTVVELIKSDTRENIQSHTMGRCNRQYSFYLLRPFRPRHEKWLYGMAI